MDSDPLSHENMVQVAELFLRLFVAQYLNIYPAQSWCHTAGKHQHLPFVNATDVWLVYLCILRINHWNLHQSGVATAHHLPPFHPMPSILCHTNSLRVLLLCGLPLFLLPDSSSFSILCHVYPLSLISTCPNILSLMFVSNLLNLILCTHF